MSKKWMIWLVICLKSTGFGYAQWTKQDSLWLQDVLAGKDSIRLNPETMRSIRDGTFLNRDAPSAPMLISPGKLPVMKDFSEYIQKEDTTSRPAMKDLPPWIFWLRRPEDPPLREQINPAFFNYSADWLKNNADRSEGIRITGDYVHVLNMLFSPKYRQHYKNSRTAEVSLKAYREAPSREMIRRMSKFREQQRALPLPLVTNPEPTGRDSVKLPSAPDSLSVVIPADSLPDAR